MAAMLRAQRERADGLLAAGRATAGLAGRVQDAVLALFRSSDPADCVSGEMPGILAVDAAHLCVEAEHPGARRLPDGVVAPLLDGRQVVFRDAPADARLLHAEAAGLARHDALVRVPGEGPPALLALLARDRHMLDPAQGIRRRWLPRPRHRRSLAREAAAESAAWHSGHAAGRPAMTGEEARGLPSSNGWCGSVAPRR